MPRCEQGTSQEAPDLAASTKVMQGLLDAAAAAAATPVPQVRP